MAKLTNSFQMVVSEKVSGKYQPRGEVQVFYPTLADMGFLEAEVKETSEDGFPVYASDLAQFTFDGILAAVKANARNKLEIVNSKVQLKEGCSIPDSTEALLESGGNNGAALAINREFLAAAKAFLANSGKSAAIQAAVLGFFRQVDTIALVEDAGKREKIRGYLQDFASTLNDADLAKFAKKLETIDNACDAVSALDDEEF